MTVLPGCVGCRTVAVQASWTVHDLKERILAETGFPVSEQRLWLGGREVRPAGSRSLVGRRARLCARGCRASTVYQEARGEGNGTDFILRSWNADAQFMVTLEIMLCK